MCPALLEAPPVPAYPPSWSYCFDTPTVTVLVVKVSLRFRLDSLDTHSESCLGVISICKELKKPGLSRLGS